MKVQYYKITLFHTSTLLTTYLIHHFFSFFHFNQLPAFVSFFSSASGRYPPLSCQPRCLSSTHPLSFIPRTLQWNTLRSSFYRWNTAHPSYQRLTTPKERSSWRKLQNPLQSVQQWLTLVSTVWKICNAHTWKYENPFKSVEESLTVESSVRRARHHYEIEVLDYACIHPTLSMTNPK